jgi:hypothetical protein
MTVCIAAACKDGNDRAIITCTDWQLSSVMGSAETGLKQRTLNHHWRFLTAGDMSEILALLAIVRRRFNETEDFDETNILTVIRSAAAERKRQKANDFTVGRYGLSYDDFIKFGKEKLPVELFLDGMSSIRDLSLGGEFLFAGFSSDTFQLLVRLDTDFKASLHEDFVTAGEGSYLAASALLHRKHSDVDTLDEAIYAVYEAKKYAERVRSVGTYTSITVFKADGTFRSVSPEGKKKLEAQFFSYGPKDLPNNFSIDKSEFFR